MKTTFKHIAIIAALPLLCMCAKNTEITKSGKVTVTASIPDVKVSLTPGDDPALSLAWETTDQILIAGSTEETFSVKEVLSDAHMASFEGNAVSGSSFTVYYPADKDILTRSYADQTQDGNNNTGHLQFNALAENLSSYEDIEFTKVNGAVKLQVKLPETVAAVSELSVTAMSEQKVAQDIFYATNDAEGAMTSTLTIKFDDAAVPDGDNVVTAYMMVSWNPVELAAGTLLQFEATASGKTCKYVKTISVSEANTIAGGETFIIDMSEAAALKHVIAGAGTQADPYLLYDAEDMVLMSSLLVADKVTYFKMMDDIDLEGVDWVGGNQASPYNQHIDFNGNDKTISNLTCTKTSIYPGLVGVLSGRVANVTFENPDVTASKHAGIICAYAGSNGTNPAIVENVNIINGKVTQNGGKGSHSGLIFGHSNVNGCEFTNITVSGTIAQNAIGDSGFIGGAQNKAATFTNCHATGTLTLKSGLSADATATNICTGGIQGFDAGSTYDGCSFSGTINGGRLCGGIVGYNQVAGVNISDCHVSNATIKSVAIGSAPGEKVGGVVGLVTGGNISECSFEGNITASGKEVGGIAGQFIGGKGQIENCDSYANISTSNGYVGGIVGRLTNGIVSECKYETQDGSKISNSAGNNVGGIVGWNETGDVIKCSVNTDITSNVSYVGGIIGNFYKGSISDCTYTGTISANNYAGGIAGSAGISSTTDSRYPATINITNCASIASITSASGNVGGICGIVELSDSGDPSTIECCYCKGTVTGNGNNTGGIIGNMKSGKISECWYSGNMTVKDNSGGIAGAQSSTGATSDVIIENCYTVGTITNTGSQKCGGIAGECCKNSKIRNCYSTMSISGGGRVFGNIAGRFNNNQWNGNQDTDFFMEVTNCIAAGSINSTATATNLGSSGAVLGNAPCKVAHYTNCWRTYGYSFKCAYAAGATLVDQGYTVTSFTVGTWAGNVGGSNNWWPYHASEASASALQTAYPGWTTAKTNEQITVSDIASAVNYSDSNAWKSDIWDLDGTYPTLKNNPEPAK